MDQLSLAVILIGGFVLAIGLLGDLIKQHTWLTGPIFAVLLGVTLGPVGLGILNPARWQNPQHILLEISRLTLAMGLMGVAIRFPAGYFRHHWRPLAIMLGLVMPLMWLASSLIIGLVLHLAYAPALLLGAIITPTDPIVASSIVTGRFAEQYIPQGLRHLLSAESGANDGLAYPFVYLPLLLLTQPGRPVLMQWLMNVIVWQIVMAVLLGAAIGFLAGYLLRWVISRRVTEKVSILAYAVALTLFELGLSRGLGTDAILSVFVSGLTFSSLINGQTRAEEQGVQEALSQFFTFPLFILFGLFLPIAQWRTLGWASLAVAVLILLFRRLPAVLALSREIATVRQLKDSLLIGWFGPIGISALFYAVIAEQATSNSLCWTVPSLVICASLLVHGISSVPLVRLYHVLRQSTEKTKADK